MPRFSVQKCLKVVLMGSVEGGSPDMHNFMDSVLTSEAQAHSHLEFSFTFNDFEMCCSISGISCSLMASVLRDSILSSLSVSVWTSEVRNQVSSFALLLGK